MQSVNHRHTICSACESCSTIRSIQKPAFHCLPMRCAYNTHRCLLLEIWRFSCRQTRHTNRLLYPLRMCAGCLSIGLCMASLRASKTLFLLVSVSQAPSSDSRNFKQSELPSRRTTVTTSLQLCWTRLTR